MTRTLLEENTFVAPGNGRASRLDPRVAFDGARGEIGSVARLPGVAASVSLSLDRERLRAGVLFKGPIGELIPGLVATASLCRDRDREHVRLDVHLKGVLVWGTTLHPGLHRARWSGHQGLFKQDLVFAADLARGEIAVSGELSALTPGGWAHHRFHEETLLSWNPTIGAVGGVVEAFPPVIDHPVFGASTSIVPTINRIVVDSRRRLGTDVGRIVKDTYFAHVPAFTINVCFSVGRFPVDGPGPYADLTSPWCNVFAGYYQIDCPKPAWKRPFAYEGPGLAARVRLDDLARLCKADWNYLCNWMYGVPREAVRPFEALDPGIVCSVAGRRIIGASRWDLADLDGFSAVTAYQSSAAGAAQLVQNTAATRLWRMTFGEPRSLPGYPASFVGSAMHARVYTAHSEDDQAFHTHIFGGTVNKAFDGPTNDAFLDEQMKACAAIISRRYPTLGFPLDARDSPARASAHAAEPGGIGSDASG